MKKILIADDHQIIRSAIAAMIESNLNNVEIDFATNYFDTKKFVTSIEYDLLILDIDMPGSLFKGMIKDLKNVQESLKILVFSMYEEKVGIQYILEGANGYLEKTTSEIILSNAINAILNYGYYYSPNQMAEMGKHINTPVLINKLSERELEVFNLLVEGNGNLEISNKLNLKMSTISTYKKRIFEKLNVKTIVELIKLSNDLH